MRATTIATLTAAAVLCAACATTAQAYRPIVDPAIGDQAVYPAALAECRALADQVRQGQSAAAGALAGALFATAIGAAFGVRGKALAQIAGGTAIVGGTQGAAYAGLNQVQIIQRCLANRGYAVLG